MRNLCVFFLRQADYLHTYHGTPIEKIMTQKDQWYILRWAMIFGFRMKPAVDCPATEAMRCALDATCSKKQLSTGTRSDTYNGYMTTAYF